MSVDIYGFVFVRCKDNEKEKLINKVKECNFEDFNQVSIWNNCDYAMIADYKKSDNDVAVWLPEQDEIESLFDGGTNILKIFSEEFSEVIAFYSIEDYYHYQHWVKGNLDRILDGNDDGINFSLGLEEAWERSCFSLKYDFVQNHENIILVDAINDSIMKFYNLKSLFSQDSNKSVLFSKDN